MKKFTWLNITLAVLVAMSGGLVASDLLAHRIGSLFRGAPATAAARPLSGQGEELSSFAPILEKGLFGKATQGKLVPAAVTPARSAGPAPSAAAVILIGTAVGSHRETFALVQKAATREERVVRLGESVFDLGPLLAVRKESIDVSIGGKRTVINTPAVGGGDAAPAGQPAAPPAAAPGALATPVGAGSYIIDQNRLNASLDNIGQAMTDARLLPSLKDGKVEGFRVSEVKPAGVFGMVGLRNGDVLLRMNDLPIDSPEKAIQSLASLKGQNRIKLDLVREGQPTTMTYDIR